MGNIKKFVGDYVYTFIKNMVRDYEAVLAAIEEVNP